VRELPPDRLLANEFGVVDLCLCELGCWWDTGVDFVESFGGVGIAYM
jgi:hypothetical protein